MSFVARLCERLRLVDSLLYHQCTDALKDMHLKAWEIRRLERLWDQFSQEGWFPVARVLQRPWWQRVWVVQEFASARDAVLYCGEYSIPWEYMPLVVWFIGASKIPGTTVDQESLERAWGIVATSQRFAFYGWSDLVNLLHRSRHLACQDPKDKVIALLGLAKSRNQACFGADYSKSLAWVYTMAFISSIRSRGDLEVLTLVDHLTLDLRFPSWVADLDRKSTTWRFNKFHRDSTPYKCPEDSLPAFSEDLNIIYADGFCIDILDEDKVQHTDEPFHPAGGPRIGPIWSWDMDAMVTRLISRSALRNQYDCGSSTNEEVRRRVEGSVYDVMIAGQLFVGSGWRAHEIQYPVVLGSQDSLPPRPVSWQVMSRHAQDQTKERTIVFSKQGYLGLAPKVSRSGDYIFILFGLQEPAILRKQDDGSFLFIGTAYVHGLMNGEALKMLEEGVSVKERVTLR
jgi:hypothetical protein